MVKITETDAREITGNVIGNNHCGTIAVVAHYARRDGLRSVVISRDRCPCVGDDRFFGSDGYAELVLS